MVSRDRATEAQSQKIKEEIPEQPKVRLKIKEKKIGEQRKFLKNKNTSAKINACEGLNNKSHHQPSKRHRQISHLKRNRQTIYSL